MTDPIERLRAADPVPEPVSHPSEARVRATLEEILMTDTSTRTDRRPDQPSAVTRAWHRDPRILGAAAALLLLVGVVGAVLASGGDSSDEPVASGSTTLPADDPDAGPDGGITPGGNTQATSCVELYDLDTLTHREYAFDGTVTSVDGQDMTFEVHEWFTGGDGDTVTLDHQGFAGMLFAPGGPALEPGTRVLVAADGGFVWSCGFTQAYDPAVAEQWRTALAG